MTNKELAFDYLTKFMFKDANASLEMQKDLELSPEDKSILLQMMQAITNNQSKEFQELQVKQMNEKAQFLKKTNEIGLSNMENTYQTIMSIKSSLTEIIDDAKRAYNVVLWMYIGAFLLGVGLIISAIVFAALGKQILAIAFGAIGLIDLMAHTLFKPPLEIQSSRSNLAQLMVILTNWFADLMNINAYMSQNSTNISWEEMEQISEKQNGNTAKMIKLIEIYGEPNEK